MIQSNFENLCLVAAVDGKDYRATAHLLVSHFPALLPSRTPTSTSAPPKPWERACRLCSKKKWEGPCRQRGPITFPRARETATRCRGASMTASGAGARTAGAPASASISREEQVQGLRGQQASASITASGAGARTAEAPESRANHIRRHCGVCGGEGLCAHSRVGSKCKDCKERRRNM
jgi:hypothetical protein